MRTINQYLFDYVDITYFGYIQCFFDGTQICITTDSPWAEIFYRDFYQYRVLHQPLENNKTEIVLWSTVKERIIFNAMREHSKIDNGITLIQVNPDNCEFFTFGAQKDNLQIVNFYINHLSFLWRHTFYFKNRAAKLINKANADRSILPCHNISHQENQSTNTSCLLINDAVMASPIKHYNVTTDAGAAKLSHSEARCCAYTAQGKQIKEIASLMNLSPRTVEVHLNKAKQKLFCNTTSEMRIKIKTHSKLCQIFSI